MPTFTEVLPATKSAANTAINWSPTGHGKGRLTISQGRRTHTEYSVSEIAGAEAGRAFHFEKESNGTDREAEGYDVFCADPKDGVRGSYHSCECKGFLRHGNCKHVEAARAILENGWAGPAPKPVRYADPILNAFFGPRPVARKAAAVSLDTADLQGGF